MIFSLVRIAMSAKVHIRISLSVSTDKMIQDGRIVKKYGLSFVVRVRDIDSEYLNIKCSKYITNDYGNLIILTLVYHNNDLPLFEEVNDRDN